MAPNSGQRHFAYDAQAIAELSPQAVPIPRPDESNLYDLPEGLLATYRALPMLAKAAVALISTWAAAATTFEGKLIWLRPLVGIAKNQRNFQKIFTFIIRAIVYFLVANLALQEVFTPPSRITTPNLMNRYFLPSKLSRYEPITLSNDQSLGVHFLQYDTAGPLPPNYSALYMFHGFGASSLSWLPVLPKLADRLRVQRTLAHDSVGFGFTDRPKDVNMYTPLASSDIGINLLNSKASANSSNVILMGHSMGSFAALEMAARLPEDVGVTVVLVAPALGLSSRVAKGSHKANARDAVIDRLFSILVSPVLRLLLRRLVGVDGFWKRGLQSVWGDSTLVSDSDALRFQWPAIGKGWEEGLLRFTRAMSTFSDLDLVQRVAGRPNARVVVILGSRDKVIPRKMVEKMFSPFPDIQILEMPGCGHDPFEEKVDDFIDLVEELMTTVS